MEIKKKDTITSLELVEQINVFRKEEGEKKELRHDNLLAIIRDEFEIGGVLKIQETPYKHPQNGQWYPMYELTFNQARQILMRESKFVRGAMIEYIDKLEKALGKKIETKVIEIPNPQLYELEIKKANLETAKIMEKCLPAFRYEETRKAMQIEIFELLAQRKIPALRTDGELFSAKDLSRLYNVTPSQISKIANELKIRDKKEFGNIEYHPGRHRYVFLYNRKAIEILNSYFDNKLIEK